MVTVAIAKSLISYIPMMYADSIPQGLQICRLLKQIEPSEIYTVVSSAGLSVEQKSRHFVLTKAGAPVRK